VGISKDDVLKALVDAELERNPHPDRANLLSEWREHNLSDDEKEARKTDEERAEEAREAEAEKAEKEQQKEDEPEPEPESPEPPPTGPTASTTGKKGGK
jgi:hypothetical protein